MKAISRKKLFSRARSADTENLSATRQLARILLSDFWRRNAVLLAFIVMIIYFAIEAPNFATETNFWNITRQITIIGIAGIGTTIVFISGGIDISMGSVIGFSGIIAATLLVDHDYPSGAAIFVALLVAGAVVGVINGFLSSVLKIPAFIATLGMLIIIRGYIYVMTDAHPVYGAVLTNDTIFSWLGRGHVGDVPAPVLIMAGLYLIAWFAMKYTRLGLYSYALGSNEKAASLSGVPVTRYRLYIFMIGALTPAIAGLILASRLGSGQPVAGDGMEFMIITAVVLGGTSIYGGKGTIVGTLLGAAFIGVLDNGMVLLGIQEFYQEIATGGILIAVLALEGLGRTNHVR